VSSTHDPRLPPRIFTKEYYDRLRDLEGGSWWNAGMRDAAALLLDKAGLGRAGRLLDVGCGSGQTMQWFARRYPGWHALGLDVAEEAVIGAVGLGQRCVMRASALALPVRSLTLDLVISLDVLQHLPLDGGDRQALAEVHRVLRPGGHLLLRTNAQAVPYVADDPVFNFHKYSPRELRQKLDRAGFRILRLGRLNALLGLAEIPREWRARRQPHSYHGVLSTVRREGRWRSAAKRAWLRGEGRGVSLGASWPLGRTILALCQRAGH
jgi:SAM-dependent methyltransferase